MSSQELRWRGKVVDTSCGPLSYGFEVKEFNWLVKLADEYEPMLSVCEIEMRVEHLLYLFVFYRLHYLFASRSRIGTHVDFLM